MVAFVFILCFRFVCSCLCWDSRKDEKKSRSLRDDKKDELGSGKEDENEDKNRSRFPSGMTTKE